MIVPTPKCHFVEQNQRFPFLWCVESALSLLGPFSKTSLLFPFLFFLTFSFAHLNWKSVRQLKSTNSCVHNTLLFFSNLGVKSNFNPQQNDVVKNSVLLLLWTKRSVPWKRISSNFQIHSNFENFKKWSDRWRRDAVYFLPFLLHLNPTYLKRERICFIFDSIRSLQILLVCLIDGFVVC